MVTVVDVDASSGPVFEESLASIRYVVPKSGAFHVYDESVESTGAFHSVAPVAVFTAAIVTRVFEAHCVEYDAVRDRSPGTFDAVAVTAIVGVQVLPPPPPPPPPPPDVVPPLVLPPPPPEPPDAHAGEVVTGTSATAARASDATALFIHVPFRRGPPLAAPTVSTLTSHSSAPPRDLGPRPDGLGAGRGAGSRPRVPAMELGFFTMNTPEDVRPDVLARALEERGYDSLFLGEHSHIPASRRTPYPAGGELPVQYTKMMDPFVGLAMAAAVTTKLQLGFGVCLVLEHHVLDLAKAVATLDHLSGGRVLFGVGVGWNVEELANHRPDIPWSLRYRAGEECVEALRRCWTDEAAEHHGRFFDFDPVWVNPKPARPGGPPVLLGTGGRLGTEHTVRWGDEWMPMDVALGNVPKKIARFREIAADAGRGDIPISLVAFGDPSPETLHRYKELGVVRTVIGGSRRDMDDPSTTLAFLDEYAPLIPDLRS